VKSIQEVTESVYTALGTQQNALYPDCVRNICSEWAWLPIEISPALYVVL